MKYDRISDSLMKISDSALEDMQLYSPGTLLMVTRSGILKRTLPLAILDRYATVNQDIKTISVLNPCLPEYVFYAIRSNELKILKEYHKDGTTVDSINFDKFISLDLPLPPLGEQKRIINEVEKWMRAVESIESSHFVLNETILTTKSRILSLAISGKLVPQDPTDEPAIDLLKRINPDFVPCDNSHYENLPNGWIAARVSDIFEINPKIQASDDSDAGFVPMASISDGFSNKFIFEVKKWGKIKNGFSRFANGDIAVAKISPCLENRKSVIMRDLPNGIGAGTTELNIFRSGLVIPEYALLFFKSDYFVNACAGSYNGVVGQQRVSRSVIEDMTILVPPIEEQKRIVTAVNKYFDVIDRITISLK